MATSWGDQTDEGGYTDEEEEKKEEGGGGNALGGFMFGNVDRNLRLEENYLDQDAIDKLGELGARLGGRLNLQRLVSENHRDEEDDDYDVKAENARDYEDEQEVIDDPGALQPPLPNFVLPLPQQPAAPGAEEDDYDDDGGATELPVLPGPIIAANVAAPEEEDYDEEGRGPTTEKWPQVPPPEEEDYDEEGTGEKEGVAKSSEGLSAGIPMEEDEEALEVSERPAEAAGPLELPVLFQKAGGEPVLRFSEIFSKRVERSTKRKKKAVKKRVQIQVSADHEESDDDEAWFRAEPRAELRKEPSADLARQPSGEGFKSLKQRGSFNWRARRPAKSDESEEEREAFEPEPDEARSSGEEGLTTEEDERRRSAADITEGGADVAVREHDLRAPEGISAEGLGDGLLEGRELMDIDDERRASHLAASTSADVIIRPRDGRAPKGRRRGAFGGNQPVRAENGEVLESLRASLPEENFALVHQVDWERNIMWDDGRTSEAMRVSRKKNPRGQEDGSFYAAEQNGTQSLPNGALSNGAMSEEESELTSSSLGGAGKNLTDQSATLAEATEGESVPPVVLEKLTKDDVTFAEGDVNAGAHPQMLRLEKRAPGSASERAVAAQELLKRMTRLELGPEDWLTEEGLDLIKDGLDKPALRAKLVLDLNDPDMVFEVRDGDKEGLKVKAHAAAIVLTANSKERPPSATLAGGENQQAAAAPHPGAAVRFNVSNDRFYQTTQVKKTKARQRAQETRVKIVHSVPALKLQTSRPTPLLKEMANFHRPRAVWFPVSKDRAFEQENGDRGQIRLVVKSLGNIGKSVTVRVKGSEALEAVRGKVMSKWKDVKKETLRFLHAGKEITDGAPLTDQSLRHDSIVHLIRTKVHPLLKANKLPKSEQPSRPPGAFKKKVDLTAKDGHVLLMEYAEERPPLLSLPGMGARLATYYRKRSSADGNAASLKSGGGFLGQIVPLEPAEPTPFLGQVPEGQSVTSLETSLYRAPAFRHKVPTTDFVLIRSNHGKLSLRKATGLHLVGQEEPSKEVMVPNSKAALKYSEARLQLHVFREFTAQLRKKKGGEHAALPMHDLARQFPGQAEQTLRKWLRPFAQFTTLGMLRKKPGFIIPQEDELRRMVAPEQVCMFEAMKAGQEYLRRAGISVLTTPGGIPLALEQIAKEVDAQTRELADYIHRELQLTPWNLTASFLTGMEGRGQMELSGLADPSGRGQGFSYLRLPARKEEDELGKKKKALLKEKEGKLTGTDADLRRLSMAASRQMLLNFGVREADIPKNRWRRIEMVRKFSSAAALEGRAGATANKFARGSRLTLMQQQEIFMKKAQEIWDAQLKALADEKVPEEAGSDGEGSDMDSFAKELEAALEEGDKDEEVAKKKDGSKGFGRGRQALQARVREEQLEDEEAEAEELRKMLQEDDEQVQGKTDTAEDKGEVEPELPEPPEAPAPAQQLPKVVKVVRIRKVDGKEVRVEEFLRDPEKIAEFYREKEKKAAAAGGSKGGAKAAPGPKPGMKKKVQRTGLVEEEDEAMIKSRKSPFKGGVKGKKFGKGGLSVQTTGLKHRGGEGTPTPKTGGKGTDRVCLKCGQVGHMSTNRACPMYNADGVEGPSRQTVLLVNEAVRVEGTKVAISRKKPPGAGGSFGGLTPKVVDAPRRAPSTLVSLKRPRKTEEELTETEPKPKKLKGTLSFVCRAEGDVSGGQKRPAERSQASPPEKKQRPQPNRKLNREFYRILKRLEERLTESYPFLDPVDEKLVPDYYDIITRPMCLTVMKEKALKAAAYKSVEELVADMELIRANAHTYNYEGIPPQADRLFDAFMTAVEAKRSNLEAIAREKPGLDET